jgi:hypothetical protein
VKVLLVSPTRDTPAFGPSNDNVHFGDYPIRLAFYLVHKPRDAAKLEPIIRLLLENDVATELRENNLFALPETVRRKLLIDLDLDG